MTEKSSHPESVQMLTTVGQKIRQLRKARGMTQGQLAQEIGRSTSCVSQIETEWRNTSLGTLRRILKVFSLKSGDFFCGIDW